MDSERNRRKDALLIAAAGIGGGIAAYQLFRKATEMSLKGKVALVTGGTRGLGLELTRQLLEAGCQVAICARDQAELRSVESQLSGRNRTVLAIPCDVSQKHEVDQMIHEVTGYFGQLDILINNAGVIQVGPIENMSVQDFQKAMENIFYGNLYPSLAVLPQMRNRRSGVVVNITSIGGKVVVPHLLPYCCAKFAATALSEGLRVESAKDGINVINVAPGTMRNASYVNADFRGQIEEEAAWFGYSETSAIPSISPKDAAARILQAIRRGESDVVLGVPAKLLAKAHEAAPSLTAGILSLVNQFLLPSPSLTKRAATGIEIQRSGKSPAITKLGESTRKMAEEYNQPS